MSGEGKWDDADMHAAYEAGWEMGQHHTDVEDGEVWCGEYDSDYCNDFLHRYEASLAAGDL